LDSLASVKFHVPDDCLGYDLDANAQASCNSTTFPMQCTYNMVPNLLANEDLRSDDFANGLYDDSGNAENEVNEQTLTQEESIDNEENAENEQTSTQEESIDNEVTREIDIETPTQTSADLLEVGKARVKGKHDAQYEWAAKAIAKSMMHSDACKPPTRGKDPPRHMDCDACMGIWGRRLLGRASPVPYPCNCGCRGWTQIANLCVQPCHEHGSYSEDTGAYCHKPCNREGQLALHTGCGLGHDRVCVKDSGACVMRWVDRAWSFADILLFVGTAGASSGMKAAASTARTAGMKAGMKAMKSAMRASAKKLAAKVAKKGFVKKQLQGFPQGLRDRILENGATMLLASNPPTDWGAVALEIAAVVDPTGVVGFAKGFIPPKDCNDAVYFVDPIPATTGGPDLDALDETLARYGSPSASYSWYFDGTMLRNRGAGSGRCVDARTGYHAGASRWSQLYMETRCTSNAYQRWHLDSSMMLKHDYWNNKCVDSRSSSPNAAYMNPPETCTANKYQRWYLSPTGFLTQVGTGNCMFYVANSHDDVRVGTCA